MAESDSENVEVTSDSEWEYVVPRFTIDSETTRQYNRFRAAGTELIVRLLPPAAGDSLDAITHFQASVNDLFEYALRDVHDSDMVVITIRNEVNLQDKAIVISLRRRDQLSAEVIGSVFSKVAQSNALFNALDRLIVIQSVRMPVGFGKTAVQSKGRPLSDMAHVKRSIIEVKAETNCLAHALLIAFARLTKDPNYNSFRRGYKIQPKVQQLLQKTGIV